LSNVNFYDPKLENVLNGTDDEQKEALIKALLCLACCHTIIIDPNSKKLNASSPDELALVNAAKQFGYEFTDVIDETYIIHDRRKGIDYKYKLLNVCEFTSTRKRMSCILRNMDTNEILLMTKGADSVIEALLTEKSKNSEDFKSTKAYVDEFATEGLRTLYLAQKTLDENEYQHWNEEAEAAKLETKDRETKVAEVDSKIELELELIGSTAIEDRL
jgi:magnesium-transporting ATPase (P-type)